MSFPQTHSALSGALAARGYDTPTAVQLAVLQPEATGRDLLVSAQTGSGKTVAFGLAFAAELLGGNDRFDKPAEPLALLIAPTRELALQVQRELEWLYADTGAVIATCVGGMDPREERRALGAGTHIVVGTPGRLRDHLERGRLDMSWLRVVVLDEADEMLDLGFREDLEFLLKATPETRRTLLFSATIPREIANLARQYQRDAFRIETVVRGQAHDDIDYRAISTTPAHVESAVVNTLRFYEPASALVFCATREAVKRMNAALSKRGFSVAALSGELSQAERTNALQSVRDGRAKIMVATDVAARGLDLPELALVVHADLPNDRETLLHRSGRTGRAGRKGTSVLIVSYNRRRMAERLLEGGGVNATWGNVPTLAEIELRDQQRLMDAPVFSEPASDSDLALARELLAGRTAEELATALVRMHRARLPAVDDIPVDRRPERSPSSSRERAGSDRGSRDREPREHWSARKNREDTGRERTERRPSSNYVSDADMVWFSLNIGREKNADPRWLLPLICKAGDITKREVGAIKIFDRETKFQILAANADQFALQAKDNTDKQGQITRVGEEVAPVMAAQRVRAPRARDAAPKPYHHVERAPVASVANEDVKPVRVEPEPVVGSAVRAEPMAEAQADARPEARPETRAERRARQFGHAAVAGSGKREARVEETSLEIVAAPTSAPLADGETRTPRPASEAPRAYKAREFKPREGAAREYKGTRDDRGSGAKARDFKGRDFKSSGYKGRDGKGTEARGSDFKRPEGKPRDAKDRDFKGRDFKARDAKAADFKPREIRDGETGSGGAAPKDFKRKSFKPFAPKEGGGARSDFKPRESRGAGKPEGRSGGFAGQGYKGQGYKGKNTTGRGKVDPAGDKPFKPSFKKKFVTPAS